MNTNNVVANRFYLEIHLKRDPRAFIAALLAEADRTAAKEEQDDALDHLGAMTRGLLDGSNNDLWFPIITSNPKRSDEWNRRAILVREAARLTSDLLAGVDVARFANSALSLALSLEPYGGAKELVQSLRASLPPISEKDLAARVRRNFAKDGLRLRRGFAPQGPRVRVWLYIDNNTIVGWTDDLEKLGREIGVLTPEESVAA